MNALMFAEISLGGVGTTVIAVFGIVLVIIIFMAVWASRYTKVGPNQVLIVSGRKQTPGHGR
jgi:uncharacterized membrane protein YqiK